MRCGGHQGRSKGTVQHCWVCDHCCFVFATPANPGQERRKYGSLGWNIAYEFNDSDLETSMEVLKLLLEDNVTGGVPWDALRFVTGHINYGGRVTDDWDRRCLVSLMHRCYNEGTLTAGYPLSSSGTYVIPPTDDIAAVRAYIGTWGLRESVSRVIGVGLLGGMVADVVAPSFRVAGSLPDDEMPEVFGLHPNASVTLQVGLAATSYSTATQSIPMHSDANIRFCC